MIIRRRRGSLGVADTFGSHGPLNTIDRLDDLRPDSRAKNAAHVTGKALIDAPVLGQGDNKVPPRQEPRVPDDQRLPSRHAPDRAWRVHDGVAPLLSG